MGNPFRIKAFRIKPFHKRMRDIMKNRITAVSFRPLLLVVFSFSFLWLFLVHFTTSDNAELQLGKNVAFKRCSYSEFLRSGQPTTGEKSMPLYVTHFLKEVEHVFLICLHQCRTALPIAILNRSTHVLGSRVDACAPAPMISGKYVHALKVTFTHAIVMQRASEMGYRHIAVIEDDVLFLQQDFHIEMRRGFKRLLNSQRWNLLRFGYRPYFLQEHGARPCPASCRCSMCDMYGEHFCHLKSTGCDLRSSDFYVIHSRSFKVFQSMLLDMTLPDTKRIVDVYPMRMLSGQWLIIPQLSFQENLDIPLDYQVGSSALLVKKCLHPRPVPNTLTAQLFRAHVWRR